MSEQSAWLIERNLPRPIWWSGFGRDAWTFNADAAVRFQRRVDAERIVEGFRLDAFVSEHLWTEGRSASAIEHLQSAPPEDEQTDQARSGVDGTEPRPNPPQGAIDIAVQMSTYSPCQSKRGATIFAWRGGAVHILGRGYNHKTKFECDSSDACKATCRIDAVHAEQMALINAAKTGFIVGMEALHVKAVDGVLVPSGGPSCVECSKLLRASGIAAVWLYHANGWQQYEIDDFHTQSLIGSVSVSSEAERALERAGAQRQPTDPHIRPVSPTRGSLAHDPD